MSADPSAPSKLRELTLMAASMIAIIGTTAIAASLPHMSEAYADVPDSQFLVRLVLTLPALSVALTSPFIGWAIDRWGRKRLFVAALLLYGVAGTAGSVLPSLPAIIASRLALGVAVSGITTCSTALLADGADATALRRLMGKQSLFMAFGNVTFVSLGGVLADVSWRLPFLLYAVAFTILPGVWISIREGGRREAAPTPAAAVASPPGDNAPVPLRKVSFLYFLAFINMAVYFMVPVHLPFHLRSFPYSSSARAGGLLALVGLSWGLSSALYARLRRRLSFEQIVIAAFCLMGTAHLLLAMATGYALIFPAMIAIGVGLGMTVPNFNAWLLSFTPPSRKGRMIGGLVFCIFVGQFSSPIITRPLVAEVGLASGYGAGGALLWAIALVIAAAELVRRRGSSLAALPSHPSMK